VAYDPDAREREALAEVAATRISRPIGWALFLGFLLLVAIGPVSELVAALGQRGSVWSDPWPSAGPGASALAGSRLAIAEIERRADQETALVRAVRPWGQLGLTALVRYGNEKAYVGREGWLVYREDFDHLTGRSYLERRRRADLRADSRALPIGRIAAFAAELERRGIALLLLPVPAKPSVHPESLAAPTPNETPRNPADADFAANLRARGVALLDPTDLLRGLADAGPAYLRTDTHWRPEAMDAVARETAIRLRAVADLPVGAGGAPSEEVVGVEGSGDTAALLRLPPGARGFARERAEIRRVLGADGSPWRPGLGAPVLLLGDSFSAIYSQPELGFGAGAGFGERLSFHLGLPIDRLVRNAGGASATRAALAEELRRDPARLDGVVAVVWQLAARELSQGTWDEAPLPPADRLATTPSRPTADSR
jgi:alginate O-acetyltransferase complex protein AlgJ